MPLFALALALWVAVINWMGLGEGWMTIAEELERIRGEQARRLELVAGRSGRARACNEAYEQTDALACALEEALDALAKLRAYSAEGSIACRIVGTALERVGQHLKGEGP